MKSKKTGVKTSEIKALQVIPTLTCNFILPTEDKKGVYLISKNEQREDVFQVDGYGSEYCRRIDGTRCSEDIADELIQSHELEEEGFKEYVIALQEDLHKHGLLSFKRN